MAWPYDDRHYDFTQLGPVPSNTLNEIEDRIVDVHRQRQRVFWPAQFENAGGTDPDDDTMSWTPQGGTDPWWGCLVTNRCLWIPISFITGAIVSAVKVKVYVATTVGLYTRLDKVNSFPATVTDAPTFSAEVTPAVVAGTPPFWAEDDLSPASPITLAAGEILFVRIGDPDVGDMVAGALVTFTPLTATP